MSHSLTSSLGKRISYARKDSSLSQKDLAEKLQISDRAVSAYEVGRATPPLETLQKISKITQKSLHYFLEGEYSESDLESKLDKVQQELDQIKTLLRQQKKSAMLD